MSRQDIARIVFRSLFNTCCRMVIIALFWAALELFFYGAVQPCGADAIISLFLFYYIYRREEYKEAQRHFNKRR